MSKAKLPDGCPESFAVYFGDYIACTATSHSDGQPTPQGERYRKWEWVPAHWREIHPKPPGEKKKRGTPAESESTSPPLSHNPVIGKVPA